MKSPFTIKSIPRLGIASLLFLGLNLAAVLYRTHHKNASPTPCDSATATLTRMKPMVTGDIAALVVPAVSHNVPELAFTGPDGKALHLSDFRGRTLLLNLWATWCVPCRTEMPALDTLQGLLGNADFEVVTVNIDQRNLDRPKAFLAEIGVKNLNYYADPSADSFQSLKTAGKATGMPTSMIISPQGCELGTIAGPADWAGSDALALIRTALGR